MSMRFCLTEAEESRLNHTVKNIKIRIKNIRIQIKNIALKKPTRDNKNLGEYAHLDELFYNVHHMLQRRKREDWIIQWRILKLGWKTLGSEWKT